MSGSPLPPRRNPAGRPYPVSVREVDGFTIHVREDGYDYLGLYRRLRDGTEPVKVLLYDDAEHYVHLVERDDRAFVFKRFGELDGKIDTKIWRFLAGPFYSGLMRAVNRAVSEGCESVQDVYLVAEKMSGRLAYDNYILVEFVQGATMETLPDIGPYRKAIAAAFADMHGHGLSLGNVKTGNLVLTESGTVRIIDLSNRGTQLIGRAKDSIKVKRLWGIDLPACGLLDGLARLIVSSQFAITKARRKIKALLGLGPKKRDDWMSKVR